MEQGYQTILPTDYRMMGDRTVYSEEWDETIAEFVSSPTSGDQK